MKETDEWADAAGRLLRGTGVVTWNGTRLILDSRCAAFIDAVAPDGLASDMGRALAFEFSRRFDGDSNVRSDDPWKGLVDLAGYSPSAGLGEGYSGYVVRNIRRAMLSVTRHANGSMPIELILEDVLDLASDPLIDNYLWQPPSSDD